MLKQLLRFVLLVSMVMASMHAVAGNSLLGSYTLKVGDSKTLYISDVMQSILGYSDTHWGYTDWTTSNSSAVSITSKGKDYCTIRASAATSTQVKIEYDIYWADYYYNYSHTKDYFYITVQGGSITISASPNGGTVTSGTKVTLSSNPTGANIYYTLDGTTPTASSNVYSSGVTITKDCTLKAIAMKSGYSNSSVLTAKYTVSAKKGDKITAMTKEGVEMTFTITDVENKYCKAGYSSSIHAVAAETTGELTIPEKVDGFTVNEINSYAFRNCEGLTAVHLPKTVTSVGNSAFNGCNNLQTITGLNSIEYIDSQAAFVYTPWYKNLDNGPVYIGKVFFAYKGNIEKDETVEIAEGCTQIIAGAFTNQNYEQGYITIRTSPFCVRIPNTVKSISGNPFSYCSNVQAIKVNGQNPVYDSRNDCNAIVETATNTIIAACASTSIPNTIKNIGSGAFQHIEGLKEIIIPNNVDSIAAFNFYVCDNLESVLVGKGVRKIGTYSFVYNLRLKEISVSPSNPYFDSRDNCNAIIETATNKLVAGCSSTIIPNSVKIIGLEAFYYNGYNDIRTINVPNSVEEVQNYAFANQSNLHTITLGSKVQTLGNYILSGCKRLRTIRSLNTFPDDIDEKVFKSSSSHGADSIYNHVILYVPKGARNNYRMATGWNLFKNIVELSEGAPYLGMEFKENTVEGIELTYRITDPSNKTCEVIYCDPEAKEKITIPEMANGYKVTCMGYRAFYNYYSNRAITELTIPETIEKIDQYAFSYNTELKEVEIPESVKSIDFYGFYGCTALERVYVDNPVPYEISKYAFSETTYENATLYVPEGTVELYKETEGWKKFQHIEAVPDSVSVSSYLYDVTSQPLYDLQGRRVIIPTKGVCIQGGRKVLR